MARKKLLVIISDDINRLTSKGELVERYYNPGEYFGEVELVAIQDDPVVRQPQLLAPTVGRAELKITALQRPGIVRSLGWSRAILKHWLAESLERLGSRPDVIRLYGLRINCLLAVAAKEKFGAPLVASVHEDGYRNRALEIKAAANLKDKLLMSLFAARLDQIARYTLPRCDRVIGVYDAAVSYIRRLCESEPELIYNAVSDRIRPKTDYGIVPPARLLYAGNLARGLKGPLNVIGALAAMDARLDVVGEGPLLPELTRIAESTGQAGKINFLGYRHNAWIAENMAAYDLYVYEFLNREFSKSVIEALHCGLPVVLNTHESDPVRELAGADFVLQVENSVGGFREGIGRVLSDINLREELGRKSREYARQHLDPADMERGTAELYRSLLEQ